MNDFLNKVPRWALVGTILVMLALFVPVATFAINTHLSIDAEQSADIEALTRQQAALTANIKELAEAVRNLKSVTENNREEHRWLHRND